MHEFLAKLKVELKSWTHKKIISEEQSEKILALYDGKAADYEKVDRSSKMITVFSILGSILLGVGVILFMASNWEGMSKLMKILVLFAGTFGTFYAGYYLRYQKANFPKTGTALLLLSGILFGASLFLIAQIYHVKGNASWLILIWALGVLPLAYAFLSVPVMALGVLVLTLWFGFFLGDTIHLEEEMINMYFVFGLLLYVIGLIHESFKKVKSLSEPMKLLGVMAVSVTTYIFTFEFFHEDVYRYFSKTPNNTPFVVMAFLTLISILIAFVFVENKSKTYKQELFALMGLAILAALFQFYPSGTTIYMLVFNLLLLGIIVGLIYLGFLHKKTYLVNLALLLFVVDVITRYFDFFYELMSRSLFFIIGGLVLLFGGIAMEKERKKLLKKMLVS
jgi:uncharacterized membrane protein